MEGRVNAPVVRSPRTAGWSLSPGASVGATSLRPTLLLHREPWFTTSLLPTLPFSCVLCSARLLHQPEGEIGTPTLPGRIRNPSQEERNPKARDHSDSKKSPLG